MQVPWPAPGFMRDVYPGFLQLSGFMSMNLDRHIIAHKEFFMHLVKNDGDSAEKHRDFYDEYLAVMDLTAEFYLQTVETVFVRHALPKGEMMHRGEQVDPTAIRNVALFTVEGENDDISGVGQTAGGARPLRQHPARHARPLPAAGGRPLRRLQRLALPLGDRAAHPRLPGELRPHRPPRQAAPRAFGQGAEGGLAAHLARAAGYPRCCKIDALGRAGNHHSHSPLVFARKSHLTFR